MVNYGIMILSTIVFLLRAKNVYQKTLEKFLRACGGRRRENVIKDERFVLFLWR